MLDAALRDPHEGPPAPKSHRELGAGWHIGLVVDRIFSEPKLAAVYDAFCPWEGRPELDFYLPRVMSAASVLDVGCGTGELLHLARKRGHTGRLCGLDPAAAMLAQARTRADIEWIHGELSRVRWDEEFDLVVMTGHAFQVLLDDDEIRTALSAIRSALTADGRFVFETRNPSFRAWERWTPANAEEVVDATGAAVRMAHEVERVDGDRVSFTTTFSNPAWDRPETSRSTLRFLDAEALAAFLDAAGLAVVEEFGDWDRQPLTETSPEIITVSVRRSARAPA